ncbi:RbsD/FucU family protein [Fundicoccus culcitae]|uniref:Fucose isomerase n=1 Tax=Fundicoccus culcitae TaxID=2969821 RepID=A0ABY5P575_9LACT|nr:RbsD/FucU domain-containing protein [Fundicoccus culcitae]UUX33760.1 fucose isomerase [Fundicoccus culcitae]
MLKLIPKTLSPDLLKILCEMGHGDTIVIADANYPSASNAKQLIRCDGISATQMLKDILTVLPIDKSSELPVKLMEVSESDKPLEPVIWDEFLEIIEKSEKRKVKFEFLDRFKFYESGKEAYAIVATGETALYGNIILTKGVVE